MHKGAEKMRRMLALIVTLGVAAGALAQSIEDYRYFRYDGIFDPSVSDETANALVQEGIASEEPKIRDLTVNALGDYAAYYTSDLRTPYGMTRERSFSTVPGLKQFLMSYWRERHKASGYDAFGAIQEGLGVEKGTNGLDGFKLENIGLDEAALPDQVWDAVRARLPAWTSVPQTLCLLYPGDTDVLELVWEVQNTDVYSGPGVGVLGLLNVGQFATADANAFRIAKLSAPGDRTEDALTVTTAAEGLALSRPVEAIPHLISAALDHRRARGDILVVLAGYDDEALSPYATELAGLLGQTRVKQPMGAVFDAFARLERFLAD